MKLLLVLLTFVLLCDQLVSGKETESEKNDDDTKKEGSSNSWWSGFKTRVKSVMSRWRDDIKVLWDEVLAKADDMRGWTSEVFESFKVKMKEWVDVKKDIPEDEKNEIDNFISKLKLATTEEPVKKFDP